MNVVIMDIVLTVGLNGTKIGATSIEKVTGEAISPFEVKCQVTRLRRRRETQKEAFVFFERYRLSIANDGSLFGIEKEVSVIDSRCQVPSDVKIVLTMKDGYCFIDRTCVKSGDHMEGERREVCSPDDDKFHWTRLEDVPPLETEPCVIYKHLPHMLNRSSTTLSSALEEILNDVDIIEGWYGMDGYNMPLTALPQSNACGGMSGIWLQGELPSGINETTLGSACVTGWLEGCVADIPVEIKSCSPSLNVYYLKPSEIMYSAYCFESTIASKPTEKTTAEPKTTESTTDLGDEHNDSSTVKQTVNTTPEPKTIESATDSDDEQNEATVVSRHPIDTTIETNTVEFTKDSDNGDHYNNGTVIGLIVAAVVVVVGLIVLIVLLFVRKAKRYSFVPERDLHVHTECEKEDNLL